MKNFAVMASGYGGNLQSIVDAVKAKKIPGKITCVVSNKQDAYALHRARKADIPAIFVDPKKYITREAYDLAVLEVLQEYGTDFIVMAGYMRLVSEGFVKAYPNKILNIHPSLLPSFPGANGIRDAYLHGVKVTGITIHIVIEEMDAGPILAQKAVEIADKDSLEDVEEKIHQVEHRLYPTVIRDFIQGKFSALPKRS